MATCSSPLTKTRPRLRPHFCPHKRFNPAAVPNPVCTATPENTLGPFTYTEQACAGVYSEQVVCSAFGNCCRHHTHVVIILCLLKSAKVQSSVDVWVHPTLMDTRTSTRLSHMKLTPRGPQRSIACKCGNYKRCPL